MSHRCLVSIFIPTYNQPQLLSRCLLSVRSQTLNKNNYSIILMDDQSSADYDAVIAEYQDLTIERVINKSNLGAVPNMLHCIKYPVDTPYKIVFHEDDIMYPDLLEKELKAFADNPEIAWVGSNMAFFTKTPSFYQEENKSSYLIKGDVNILINAILNGRSLSLASIMYKTSITEFVKWDLDKYSMMGDRQMLVELAKEYGCIYLNYDLVAAYDHSESDFRWKTLRQDHIHNFYEYLSGFFSENEKQSKNIQAMFTYGYINNFKLLMDEFQSGKLAFYWRAHSKSIFSFKYYLLSFGIVRTITDFLKRNNK